MKKLTPFICLIIGFISINCKAPLVEKVINRQMKQIGSMGSKPGQFIEPRGITINVRGNLMVTDFRNYRVQEITTDGEFIQEWGTHGSEAGELNDPTCAVMDLDGNLYIADSWNHRIQKCDASGNWTAYWAKDKDFWAPRGIAVDHHQRIYVANTTFNNVKVFNKNGDLIATWGHAGAGLDDFQNPLGLAFGPDRNLYVADTGNQRIKVMDVSGKTLNTFRVPDWPKPGSNQFSESYIAVGADGKIYTTVPNQNTILVFTPNGKLYSRFGESGAGPEQLSMPTGIAVDTAGFIYISDTLNNRVVKYAPAPALTVPEPEEPGIFSKIFSVVRYFIDLIALFIIIKWLLNKRAQPLKEMKLEKEEKVSTRWNRFIEQLLNEPILMTITYCFALILLSVAIISFVKDSPNLGFSILIASAILFVFFELPEKYSTVFLTGAKSLKRLWFWIFLVVLLLITLGLRFYKLGTIPNGINNDAAWNGMYAIRILEGEPYTPFTAEAWGKST
ncbi:NHL repeat-containing protein, partial [bacterium]|nr:NHL repeat-containing protein [candidate division CSSED10-310 bacterium]